MLGPGVLSGPRSNLILCVAPSSASCTTRVLRDGSQVSYPWAGSITLRNCKVITSVTSLAHGGNTYSRLLRFNLSSSITAPLSAISNKYGDRFEEDAMNIDPVEKETEKAWSETIKSFKQHASKMKNQSQEAYELYCQKATVILRDTSEQLKIHAEKVGHDLCSLAKDISEGGKEYITIATEKSPKPVKDVVETFSSSADELDDISKVYDFFLGIPYGLLLCVGGFLSFMLTGSIPAIRFGVILGGALLALSVSSLRLWKSGQSFDLPLKGQAAIAGVLFLREAKVLLEGHSFWSYLKTLLSGSMVGFYLYRIMLGGGGLPQDEGAVEQQSNS